MPVNARGFTLVELLVTLVLIAVLASLAAPRLGEIKREHERNAARASLLQAFAAARHGARAAATSVTLTLHADGRLTLHSADGALQRETRLPGGLRPGQARQWRYTANGEFQGDPLLRLEGRSGTLELTLAPGPTLERLAAAP